MELPHSQPIKLVHLPLIKHNSQHLCSRQLLPLTSVKHLFSQALELLEAVLKKLMPVSVPPTERRRFCRKSPGITSGTSIFESCSPLPALGLEGSIYHSSLHFNSFPSKLSQVHDSSTCCHRRKNPPYIFFCLYCLPQLLFWQLLLLCFQYIRLFLHSQFLLQLCHHGHVFPHITLPVQKSVSYVLFFVDSCKYLSGTQNFHSIFILRYKPQQHFSCILGLHPLFWRGGEALWKTKSFHQVQVQVCPTVLASKNFRQPSSNKASKINSFISWVPSFWLLSLSQFFFLLTEVI